MDVYEVVGRKMGSATSGRPQATAKWQESVRALVSQPLWSPGYAAAPQHTPDGTGRRNNSEVPMYAASQPPVRQPLQVGPQPQSAGSFLGRWIRSPSVTGGVQPQTLRCRLAPNVAPDLATTV